MHRTLRIAALASALLFTGCTSVPYERPEQRDHPPAAVQPPDGSAERIALNASVYDAAVHHVDKLFYRKNFDRARFAAEAAARRAPALAQPDEAGLHAQLDGLLDKLDDDHTYTLSPIGRERAAARRNGQSHASYGLLLSKIGARYLVSLVRPDSPAAEAGVLPGWQVASIDGQSPDTSPPPIEGRSGRLMFVDDAGGERTMDLAARAMPPLPRRESRRLEGSVAYLRFDDFDRPTYDWFKAEVEALVAAPPSALVLDLRRNDGGLASIAALVNSHFHTGRQDFLVLQRRFIDRRLYAPVPASVYAGPMAVLVGPATTSSAELLAARLQDTGRARLVGERTRGAVVGTRGINLPDGGLLYVGMWVMTTPAGRNLEKTGVAPDLPIPADWEAVRAGRDPALEAALASLAK